MLLLSFAEMNSKASVLCRFCSSDVLIKSAFKHVKLTLFNLNSFTVFKLNLSLEDNRFQFMINSFRVKKKELECD